MSGYRKSKGGRFVGTTRWIRRCALFIGLLTAFAGLQTIAPIPTLVTPAHAATGDYADRSAACAMSSSVKFVPPTEPGGYYRDSGPFILSARCIMTTRNPLNPIVSLDHVRVVYEFAKGDRPLLAVAEFGRDPGTELPNAGHLDDSVIWKFKASDVGAEFQGIQSCAAWLGPDVYDCGLLFNEPGTTGFCTNNFDPYLEEDTSCPSDPINPINGAYSSQATDVALSSSGLPITLDRYYDSTDRVSGIFGPGWSTNIEARLFGADVVPARPAHSLGTIRQRGSLLPGLITDVPPWPDDPDVYAVTRTVSVEEELSPAQSISPNSNIVFRAEGGGRMAFDRRADGTYAKPNAYNVSLERTAQGFLLTRADQATYAFDDKGRLLSQLDRNGRGVSYTWDTSGHLSHAEDIAGHTADFFYANKRLDHVEFSGGRTVSYGYANGLLTRVTDATGGVMNYHYTPAGLLDTITDANGNVVADNTYNTLGQVVAQTDGEGKGGSFAAL